MIIPDWQEILTAEKAEKELTDFHFIGPGIYHSKNGDSLLVIPMDRPRNVTWVATSEKDERFRFLFYNGRNIADEINLLTSAPTRT